MRFNDVEGAAEFLDDVHPDWYNKVDTKIINMASFTSCVLGQLYDGYSNGCKVLAIISYDEMRPFCGEYNQWVKEIENRRNKMKEYDMKTNPWFIRINDEEEHAAVVEFLKEKGYADDEFIPSYNSNIRALTNAYSDGSWVGSKLMWSDSAGDRYDDVRKEIVVKFKSTLSIDSVVYPDVESPTQQKMRELEEQQRKIADEIAELRKMM